MPVQRFGTVAPRTLGRRQLSSCQRPAWRVPVPVAVRGGMTQQNQAQSSTPLLYKAAAEGDSDAVGHLLSQAREAGTATNLVSAADEDGATALHVASHHGHVGVVQQLIKAGAAVTAQDARWDCPLHHAGKCQRCLHSLREMLRTCVL